MFYATEHYLLYWPDDKLVTTVVDKFVVKASDNSDNVVVGRTVTVKKFERMHKGIVAAIGKQIVY